MIFIAKSVFVFVLSLALPPLSAQGARDPTLPPTDSGLVTQALPKNASQAPEGSLSIVVRDGTYFVVQGTRLLAQGQKLGEARIERISETEVWLRQRGVLSKRQLFAGIVRRSIPSAGVSGGLQISRSSP